MAGSAYTASWLACDAAAIVEVPRPHWEGAAQQPDAADEARALLVVPKVGLLH